MDKIAQLYPFENIPYLMIASIKKFIDCSIHFKASVKVTFFGSYSALIFNYLGFHDLGHHSFFRCYQLILAIFQVVLKHKLNVMAMLFTEA
jgi:hypothetical protein